MKSLKRLRYAEVFEDSLQTSSITEPQTKKHLTAEEHAMRRAEMARRRKNLSEKRNEEEKVFLHSFHREGPPSLEFPSPSP